MWLMTPEGMIHMLKRIAKDSGGVRWQHCYVGILDSGSTASTGQSSFAAQLGDPSPIYIKDMSFWSHVGTGLSMSPCGFIRDTPLSFSPRKFFLTCWSSSETWSPCSLNWGVSHQRVGNMLSLSNKVWGLRVRLKLHSLHSLGCNKKSGFKF